MNVVLTGATGYIGSAVLSALLDTRHAVTALVRDEQKAEALRRRGVTAVVSDMRDQETVERLAATADAVIATASPGDETSGAAESAFVDAVLAGLPAGHTFIRTGGAWVYGSGAQLTEDSPLDAPGIVSWRRPLDERALTTTSVRSILIEPGIVYGHGHGIPHVVASAAQTEGDAPALVLVGPGHQHWTTIHADDLAALYVAALTHGDPGSRFLAVSGENPTTYELGVAASLRRGLQGRVVAEDPATTVARLGAFGEALLLDQQASGLRARDALHWAPTRASLITEIANGGYDQE